MSAAVGYRKDVQGLRGVAVLVVVLFHAGLGFPGGFVGVDVFFVISGFVIARGLVAEAQTSGRVSLRQFYARRVRRLLPALAVMLTVVSLAVVLLMAPAWPQPNALETARAANFSVSNLYLYAYGAGYFNPVDEHNPFVHTWSLGVEEQFYLLFPVLVAVSWWIARRWRPGSGARVFSVIAIVGGAASLWCSIAWTFGWGPLADVIPNASRFAFYGPIARIWEFMAGIGLALLARRWAGPRSSAIASVIGLTGLGLVLLASLTFSETTPFPGVAVVLPVAGAVLVILAAGGIGSSLLELPILTWLGDRSYGWYLWHWPAIVLVPMALPDVPAVVPLAAAASLVPAALSYRYLEQRFQVRRGQVSKVTAPRLAAVSVAVPMVTIALALVASGRGLGLDPHPELATESTSQAAGCFRPSTPLEDCTFRTEGARGTIMVVGDSHADVVSDAVIEIGNSTGYDVVVQSALGCAFVSRPMDFDPDCVQRQQQILTAISDVGPDLVVLANNTPDAVYKLAGSAPEDDLRRPSDEMLDVWSAALETTLTDIAERTDRVVVMSTVPVYTSEEFDSTLPTMLRPNGGELRVSLDEVASWRQRFLDAEARAIDASGVDVVVAEPLPVVCRDGSCSIRQDDGTFLYRDPNHLTRPIASQLDDVLGPAIERALA